ncbi:MAG: DEAD/DEAH box helicase [Anaerolineae bacterium]|nr:DEAD/DEAH box helicase [Anaerolineae bacterium]
MHVLHGTWLTDDKRYAFWGEAIPPPPRQFGRRPGGVLPHPFALTASQLFYYLDRFIPDCQPGGIDAVIWLPGDGDAPQPSPEALEAGAEPVDGMLRLQPWELKEVITLSSPEALDLLLRLPLPDERTIGFVPGSDLVFWQQAADLVRRCLVEQRYVPALEMQGARYLAMWKPRPDPGDLARLAAQMPPLCRAMVMSAAAAPAPQTLLDDFVQATLDAFIRATCEAEALDVAPDHRWFRAFMHTHDRFLNGTPRENRQLYDVWQAAWGDDGPGTFRVCFRLDEPAGESDEWPLYYLLQAVDDPSLLVEAEVVWGSTGRTLTYLERRFDRPHEKLLAALGAASGLFAPIERSLHQANPVRVMLSREEAYRFLVEAAPRLEARNFGVLVPNWWGRAARIRARATLKDDTAGENASTGLLSRDALIGYEWRLSLGGETVEREEFEQLVALKQPLVRFRDEWVALDPEQVEAALRFFEQHEPAGAVGLLDALRLSADAGRDAPEGLEVEIVEVRGWLNDFFERLRGAEVFDLPPVPAGLNAVLRPYQVRGFAWLVQMRRLGLGACLADDMGLGKTIQAITLWLHEREHYEVTRPVLVVCPTSVVGNWRHEIRRFAPALRVMTHHGPDREHGKAFAGAVEEVDVVLTSYALLSRDVKTLARVRWSGVVLDEAQNIKNPSTKQAQAARALKADHRLALTGTPVENRLSELWSILHFLNPGYLGSRKVFHARFAVPIERHGDEQAAGRLRQLAAPFILRRVKTDPNVINDLPDKFENKVYCTLTPEQATLYEAVVREELAAVDRAESAMKRRGGVLRMLTRLKQICNHPAHFLKETSPGVVSLKGRSGKLIRLTEILQDIFANGDRTLIFTQYATMGKLLRAYFEELSGEEVLFLYGGTPSKKRAELIERFQSPGGPRLFILSLKAGGTGLNLTAANNVFHYDRWYNPAVEDQATDRAFRIGQTRNVQVHKLLCLGTLEERIDELIEHKQALAETIVGSGEQWLSEMGTEELRELVELRQDALE